MGLGQLHRLESLFIDTGWLAAQCRSFNRTHSEAIQGGMELARAPDLYGMDTFVVTPLSKPGPSTAREHDANGVIPCAHRASSFSELVNPHGLYVHCFVSHFWGNLFKSTVKALGLWAKANFERMQAGQAESLVFWICLFALNQHDVTEELGENPLQAPFNAALAHAEAGAVMILDEDVNPLKRIWCLFEISRLNDLQKPLELITPLGPLSQVPEKSDVTGFLHSTCRALSEVSARKATSSVEADKYRIWATVADRAGSEVERGLGLSQEFSKFDDQIRSLLSTSMLDIFVARGEYASAAKCCEYGASFAKEHLSLICSSFASGPERTSWLNALLLKCTEAPTAKLLLENHADVWASHHDGTTALMRAARGGHESVALLLLEYGAGRPSADHDDIVLMAADHEACCWPMTLVDVEYDSADVELPFLSESDLEEADVSTGHDRGDAEGADSEGNTALMTAAMEGHESMVKLLLEHRADARAANHDGATALMAAALRGHESMTRRLLEHRADVGAANNDGATALLVAALRGHESIAKLLLEHGADAGAASNDGATALMTAALRGRESMAKLLLEHRADARAANNDGATALMTAATEGHESMVKLLLEHRADAGAANDDGATALMAAALRGHESMAKLLLEHRADAGAASNDGATALMGAATEGHESMAKLLLEHRADAGAANNNGATAPMAAAFFGHESMAELLWEHMSCCSLDPFE
ncbi:unnamed protein product [Durusdinium trenchii]|uniref:Ankyrin repeat protein n=1 Tax=Durusdinium trenchii TaxID=1381693 RepID=A0ABP0LU88_9DINO